MLCIKKADTILYFQEITVSSLETFSVKSTDYYKYKELDMNLGGFVKNPILQVSITQSNKICLKVGEGGGGRPQESLVSNTALPNNLKQLRE